MENCKGKDEYVSPSLSVVSIKTDVIRTSQGEDFNPLWGGLYGKREEERIGEL